VETLSIIAEFDVPGNVFPGVFAGGVDGTVDPFDFDSGVERLGESVVEAHSGGPDRPLNVEEVGDGREGRAGVLRAAIGVKPNSV
jgi:hypothetical protein